MDIDNIYNGMQYAKCVVRTIYEVSLYFSDTSTEWRLLFYCWEKFYDPITVKENAFRYIILIALTILQYATYI